MKITNLRLIAEYIDKTEEYPFSSGKYNANGISFLLEEKDGTYRVAARGEKPLALRSMAVEFTYQSDCDFTEAHVYQTNCRPCWKSGYVKVEDALPESLNYGVVCAYNEPCFYMGTMLPQNTLQEYWAKVLQKNTLLVTAKVQFTRGQAKQTALFSEWVWLCDTLPLLEATRTWAALQPALEEQEPIAYGWNSWDYYFETVSHQDVMENAEAIRNDPVFSQKVKYITIDDGWSHDWGEWEPNYRFPKGMKHTADCIRAHGFVPGIWTSPFSVRKDSYYGRRCPDFLVKDDNGDPYGPSQRFFVDPTSPSGEKFLFDLYKGLYDAGYRFFKTDFISDLLNCPGFFREELGYYEVIRHFYKIMRSAVGEDAKILGCNLPAEVGGGVVESNRIGLDIHNNWNDVKRIVDYLQARFWWGEHVSTVDSDFMLARGPQTSTEQPCNAVTLQSRSNGKDISLFTPEEAKSWVRLSAFCGGNRMLSDRISVLTDEALSILYDGFSFEEHPHYVPLDFGRKPLAEYWYKKTADAEYLLIINFEETPQMMGEGIDLPFAVAPQMLAPHASVLIKR